jgi:AcrR family transcriptional regulator
MAVPSVVRRAPPPPRETLEWPEAHDCANLGDSRKVGYFLMQQDVTPASRPYRLLQRLASVEERRARLVAAARSQITSGDGLKVFTLDAIAKAAGVTRTTVYNQFQSKSGLLEAVCDDIAAEGGIRDIEDILDDPDPINALRRYVAAFVKLYSTDRLLFRRLFALAALDPEFGLVLGDRADRRRKGLRHILGRIHRARSGLRPSAAAIEAQSLLLKAILGFEVFDTLSAGKRGINAVTHQLQDLAVVAVGHP